MAGVNGAQSPPRQKSPGAKAQFFFQSCTARLKSCPDTKPQSSDYRKLAHPSAYIFKDEAGAISTREFRCGALVFCYPLARYLLLPTCPVRTSFTARLKSCPDTKPQNSDYRKTRASECLYSRTKRVLNKRSSFRCCALVLYQGTTLVGP
jgi:hypothetical protein